jgi:hypothetical protein
MTYRVRERGFHADPHRVLRAIPRCDDETVLAALNFGAVLLGVAAGGLTASILSLALGVGLGLIGDWGPDVGLVIGIVCGLAVGGWLAGSRSRHSHRFHGSVTALVLAFVIVIIARFGGSPASTGSVLWLALLSIVIGGVTGWLAGRGRMARR